MNLIQVSNQLKDVSDQQLIGMMQNPSPAAPSYLVLTELGRRKEMRSGAATQTPQGTMAEQYTQGLGAKGPQNLAGVMGQSQMTGQPVPYAGGQMQAQNPQMQNPMMEQGAPQGSPQGFASGGLIPGFAPFSPGGGGLPILGQSPAGLPTGLAALPGAPGGAAGPAAGAASQQAQPTPLDMAIQQVMGGAATGEAGAGQGGNAGAGTGDDGDGGTGGGTGGTYADGGEVSQPMYMSPYEARLRQLSQMPLNTPGDIRPPIISQSTINQLNGNNDTYGYKPVGPGSGSAGPYTPSQSGQGLTDYFSQRFSLPTAATKAEPFGPPQESYGPPQSAQKPTGLWGSDAPPGTGVTLGGQQPEEYGPPAELGPNGGPQAGGGTPNMDRVLKGLGASVGGGGAGGGAMSTPKGLADFIGEVRAQMGPDRYAALSKDNAQAKADLKAAKETDKGLALLQAGLGILGGTSPNAGINIGRGASMGLQAYQESNRDNARAEQGLRTADQQIAIAQANRDERLLETALKSKMHWEEQIQRSLDRQASAGAAAGARADAQEMRKAALEDSKLNRAETRALKEHDSAVKTLTEASQELHMTDTAMTAISKDMGIQPTDKEAMLGPLRIRNKNANDAVNDARARLKGMQGEQDQRKGRAPAAPVGPAGVYIPGKGIQWAN